MQHLQKTGGWGTLQCLHKVPIYLAPSASPLRSRRLCVILFFSAPNLHLLTFNYQPLLLLSLPLYFVASLLPTSSFLTSHGIITCRKITGSGHTFTCRPRCPPCGLIHASFGTSPLLRIKYASDIGTCVSKTPAINSIGAVGFPSSPCETSDIFGKMFARSSTVFAPS